MTYLSCDEYHAISGAIRDPKFPSMLTSYVREISDPIHRLDRIKYMLHLEAEGQLPPGKALIRPEPWISLETKLTCKSDETRVFINVLSSDAVDSVSHAGTNSSVDVPLIVSDLQPCTMEDALCANVDAVVGVDTAHRCEKGGSRMIVLLINLIFDHLNASRTTSQGRISKDFRLRREWKYRGNLPADHIIPILTDASNISRTRQGIARTHHKVAAVDEPVESTQASRFADQHQLNSCRDESNEGHFPTEPHFDVTFIMKGNDSLEAVAVRAVVRFQTVVSLSEISIDDTADNEVTVKYRENTLRIPMKCKFDRSTGKAQFDKSNNNLTITWNL